MCLLTVNGFLRFFLSLFVQVYKKATDLCVLILYPISLLKMFLRCKVFCFVLFCLVWFGLVWFGLVRFGLVWFLALHQLSNQKFIFMKYEGEK